MSDFVCPDCGVVIKNNKSANRKRCPWCAYLVQKERHKLHSQQRREELREDAAIRKLGRGRPPKEKPQVPEAVKQRQEADEKLDEAAAKMRREKCRNCQYALHNCDRRYVIGCDYYGRTGRLRDKSGGPGTCGSYQRRRPESRKERILRSERKLEAIEADGAASKNRRV